MAHTNYHFKLRMRKDLPKKTIQGHTISSALEKFRNLVEEGYSMQVAMRLASQGLPDHLIEDFRSLAKENYPKIKDVFA